MTTCIRFDVTGRPAPQGSKRALGPGRMVEMSHHVGPWRAAVTATALHAKPPNWVPLDGPLWFEVDFRIAQPARSKFWAPAVPPDLSKLVRATEDALTTAGIWVDDARVTKIVASKTYTTGRDTPGAFITIGTIEGN